MTRSSCCRGSGQVMDLGQQSGAYDGSLADLSVYLRRPQEAALTSDAHAAQCDFRSEQTLGLVDSWMPVYLGSTVFGSCCCGRQEPRARVTNSPGESGAHIC
jgi:hypothetical protein